MDLQEFASKLDWHNLQYSISGHYTGVTFEATHNTTKQYVKLSSKNKWFTQIFNDLPEWCKKKEELAEERRSVNPTLLVDSTQKVEPWTEEQIERFRKEFSEQGENENSGRIMVGK